MAKNLTTGLQRGLRQSIAGGLGTGDLFSTASLDLQFARHKSLDSRVTHTRQSSGTYVGSDGLIKTATTNLLTYSEDFSNAEWDALTSATKVSATGVDDPAGGTTASTWKNDGTTPADGGIRRTISGTSGLPYTYSVWIRRRTGTGDISMVVGQNVAFDVTSQVTSEWNRISVTNTADANTRGYIFIRTPGDEIDIWGAQLEQSSTVGQYVKTTSAINSAPRFDHDPTTLESLGLLVEESRTNLLLQSEDFLTSWTLDTGDPTLSTNSALAPNGTTTADKLVEGITNGGQDVLQAVSIPSTGQYTYSVYAKAAERFKILLRESTSTGAAALYDLSAGSVVVTGGGGTPSPSPSIQSLANGWYRCQVTMNQSSTGNRTFRVFVVDDAETTLAGAYANRAGDGTSGIYIWGAQLEAGPSPTSYIPTTSATVTRAADVASISGSNYSSWFNASEGTLYTSALSSSGSSTLRRVAFGSDGTTGNRWGISITTANYPEQLVSSGGSLVVNSSVSTVPATGRIKVAAGFKANDFAVSANGSAVVADFGGNMPVGTDRLDIGKLLAGGELNGTIRRLVYWGQRLPNATLVNITT